MTLCPYIQVIGNDEFLAEGLHLKSHNALYTYAGPGAGLICMFFLFICAIYTMFKFFQVSRCLDAETE